MMPNKTKFFFLSILLLLMMFSFARHPLQIWAADQPAVPTTAPEKNKSSNPTTAPDKNKNLYNKNAGANPLTQQDIDDLNPLKIDLDSGQANDQVRSSFFNADGSVNLAAIINRALTFIFPLAGLILFVMIVWGGFEMLMGATSQKSLDAGKQRVVAALIGFFLLFSSYWITQIVEQITGVDILGL